MAFGSTGTVGRTRGQEPDNGRLHHNICPGVPCPETVLVVRMTGGSYLLMVYPHQEPAAFVVRTDADLLHGALQAAIGCPAAKGANGDGNPAPEDGALPTKRIQS
jgi:hypothetical protein